MPTASGKPTKAEAAPHLCRWWFACMRTVTTTRHHPVLGEVPVCNEHKEN